jgi:hypothetical protein
LETKKIFGIFLRYFPGVCVTTLFNNRPLFESLAIWLSIRRNTVHPAHRWGSVRGDGGVCLLLVVVFGVFLLLGGVFSAAMVGSI